MNPKSYKHSSVSNLFRDIRNSRNDPTSKDNLQTKIKMTFDINFRSEIYNRENFTFLIPPLFLKKKEFTIKLNPSQPNLT